MGEPLSQAEIWKDVLENEKSPLHKHFRLYGMLPSSPRCKLCHAPFGGAGGVLMRLIGREPSRMNPRMCGVCERLAKGQPGGAEVRLSLLFADIRGSSALAETLGTKSFSDLIARFYNAATDELVKADGLVDRLIGDEVIGLFLPALAGSRHSGAAMRAAEGILRATGHDKRGGPWVPIGAGIHTGTAFVGSVGSSGVSDITALGDDVNLTARLASAAAAGEILITEAARADAGLATDGLESRHLELKGRKEPVDVWVMRIGAGVAKHVEESKTA
jgi:adenylate cyclase